MTPKEYRDGLKQLAYMARWHGKKARLDKTRDKCLGREMAYTNALERFEILELDNDITPKKERRHGEKETDQAGSN